MSDRKDAGSDVGRKRRVKTRELLITMRVTVSDLPSDERKETADLSGVRVRDLPKLADTTPDDANELADIIAAALADEAGQAEMFSGSGQFVKFASVQIDKSVWADDTKTKGTRSMTTTPKDAGKAGHTPKWMWVGSTLREVNGQIFTVILQLDPDISVSSERRHLIAAAPELLAALEGARDALWYEMKSYCSRDEFEAHDVVKPINAALQSARGEGRK